MNGRGGGLAEGLQEADDEKTVRKEALHWATEQRDPELSSCRCRVLAELQVQGRPATRAWFGDSMQEVFSDVERCVDGGSWELASLYLNGPLRGANARDELLRALSGKNLISFVGKRLLESYPPAGALEAAAAEGAFRHLESVALEEEAGDMEAPLALVRHARIVAITESAELLSSMMVIADQLPQIECLLCFKSGSPFPRVTELTNLRQLQIVGIQLSFEEGLPSSISCLFSLRRLSITRSAVWRLPSSIGNLTQLTDLSLRFCSIEFLPEEMTRLTNLRSLDLAFNDLVPLPTHLATLPSLVTLSFAWNDWTNF